MRSEEKGAHPRDGICLPAILTILLLFPASWANAELGALMSAGAAFIDPGEVNRVASDLHFKSLPLGLDGGVQIQFGNLSAGWSGMAGIDALWTRRRMDRDFTRTDGFSATRKQSFQVTALSIPVSAVYSWQRLGGRLFGGAGAGYAVVSVSAESADLPGTSWFPNDGITETAERSAHGPTLHLMAGYERPSPIGGLGGGVILRRARFKTDDAPGASEFDVDLSGVSLFLSLSIRQQKN